MAAPPAKPGWIVPAVLMLASTVSMLATDLYTPSLPMLTDVFGAPAETIQLTMTLNLAGFAVGQLLFGPISDRLGRKPAMLLGLGLFAIASVLCAIAWSAEALIAARIFQGLVAACEAVIGMAVIKEIYGEEDGVRIVAIYGLVIAAAPAVGPLIGGQMLVLFGWQSNFWLLSGLAVIAWLAIWRFLIETVQPDRTALQPSRLRREAALALRVPAFWLYTIGPAAALAGLFAYITEGPFVLIDQLGVAPQSFGYYHAIVVAAFFVTNIAVNRYSERVESLLLLRLGTVMAMIGAAAAIGFAATATIVPWSLIVAVSFFASSIGLIYAVAPLKALASTKASTGMAASLRGFLEMMGAMAGSAGVTALHDGTEWPLVTIMAGSAVFILIGDFGARYAERRAPMLKRT